jgi:hypothetical protein
MPQFVRRLILVFVGLPALVMWVGGVCVTGPAVALMLTQPRDKDVLLTFGIAVAAAVMGFAMISAYGVFVNEDRHGIAPSRLPALIAMGSAGQLLGCVGLCTFVAGAIEVLKHSGSRMVISVYAISLTSLVASFYLHRLALQLRAKWKFEHRLQRDGREVVRRGA